MRTLIITLLFVALIATSCHKDDLNYNYYSTLSKSEVESSLVQIDSTNIIFKQHIIETQTILLSTFVIVIRQAMFQPELYGLVGNVAQTRSCPDPTIFDNSSGAGGTGDDFEKQLTLTFVEAPSTTQCTANGIDYEGILEVTFDAGLGQSDVDDIDVQLTQITNFKANGYSFTGGTIDLESNGGFGYDYTISGSPLICSKDGVTTSVPVGTTGTFSITDEGELIDMPQLWVDNPFELSLNDALLTCTNSSGAVSTFCSDTEENIKLDPFDGGGCSCPTDGILRIKDNQGDCTTPIDEMNSGRFDFGDGSCSGEYVELEKVIEFISYEGSFTAIGNEADGITSVQTDVSESSSTPIGNSIQLTGTGSLSSDFTWTGPSAESPGMLNVGQTLNSNPSSMLPWINEIHYDNVGGDTGEFIEIAGPAGTDLSEYKVVFYDGGDQMIYNSSPNLNPTGVIPDESNGFGALHFLKSGIQQGPDGIALIKRESDPTTLGFCN